MPLEAQREPGLPASFRVGAPLRRVPKQAAGSGTQCWSRAAQTGRGGTVSSSDSHPGEGRLGDM